VGLPTTIGQVSELLILNALRNINSDSFEDWRQSLGRSIYFCPDIDDSAGYYEGSAAYGAWYAYWGPVVDCMFSWEAAWPVRTTPNPGTVG
jgi:hypothetical protein